jgi:transposase
MNNATIIGIDLAKRVFHAHGAHIDGSVAFRKRFEPSSNASVPVGAAALRGRYGGMRQRS